MSDQRMHELRLQLAEIDRQILERTAQRLRVAEALGDRKRELQLPQRDFSQEKLVVDRAQRVAAELGVSPAVAEDLVLTLIRACSTVEEHTIVRARGTGGGRRVLIIGIGGKMGGWMARFLASQGFSIEGADPAGNRLGLPCVDDWRTLDLDAYVMVVVATPLRATNATLAELAERRPTGIVFDVGSLKSPLRSGLEALRSAGVRTTSIHPMFGPDTNLLSGRHIIFIDLGDQDALDDARDLFTSTAAELVTMTLDEHDKLIAYVLGLSHALNIAFFTALAESGEAAPRLARMSSTTFDSQLHVAEKVAEENPWLYFDIQALNDYGGESLSALGRAVEAIRDAVGRSDVDAFVQIMQRGREYLAGRRAGSGAAGTDEARTG